MSIRRSEADGRAAEPEARGTIRLAWDGDPPQTAAARQRLLEATARCIARGGMAGASVAAIASEAGVSRQTVYRYFRSRREITREAILAATEAVLAAIERRLEALTDPADMIVEALVLGLGEVRRNPVLRGLYDASPKGPVNFTGQLGMAQVRRALAPAVAAAGWVEAEAEEALELSLRLFLSLVISPEPERDADELRGYLYRHLVPGLGLGTSDEM